MVDLYASSNTPQHQNDAFQRYITDPNLDIYEWKDENIYQWWALCPYPELRQWAFDTLTIPAMSAELERVFSQAKRFFTDDRNRWLVTSFEAVQCLKQWQLQGVYDVTAPEE